MWTKQRYMDETRELLLAKNSQRWDPASTLLYHLNHASNDEWQSLLEELPDYRVDDLSLVPDASSRIPLASLSTGAGDAAHRFFAIRTISQGGRPFYPRSKKRWPSPNTLRFTSELIYRLDDTYLYLGPQPVSGSVDVSVSHRPVMLGDLSSGSVQYPWPEGYEYILVFATARLAAMKGAEETEASMEFRAVADEMRRKMLSWLSMQSGEAQQIEYADDASDWTP